MKRAAALAALAVTVAACGTTRPATPHADRHRPSAYALALTVARDRTKGYQREAGKHIEVLVHDVAPMYVFAPAWQCVVDAIAAHAYTMTPVRAAREYLPGCVATAEVHP